MKLPVRNMKGNYSSSKNSWEKTRCDTRNAITLHAWTTTHISQFHKSKHNFNHKPMKTIVS